MSFANSSSERMAAAKALRELGHAIVGHEIDDEILARITTCAEGFVEEAKAGATRARPSRDVARRLFDQLPEDGTPIDHYPDCVVAGSANPQGIAIAVHREGDDSVAEIELGPAYEGAPGRAHGGIVAAIFDETMSFVLSLIRTPAFTVRLSVSYRAPAPLRSKIVFRARLRERVGRKIWIEAEAYDGETRFAEAEGMWIAVPPEAINESASRG